MAFELNLEGGAEVLQEMVADEIAALAQQIGGDAGEGAEVETYVTDRAAAAVSVPADAQARDGVLTKAAAAAGLEVTAKPERTQRRSRSRRQSRKGAAK